MAVTLIGENAMSPMLAGRGRVLIANRTTPDDAVIIAAAAVVRHRSDGTTQRDAAFGLDIQADESIALDAVPPENEMPDAVEVLLRLQVGDQGAMVDAYATARRSTTDPDAPFEVGVKRHDGVIVDGEDFVRGFAEFATYGIPVG